MKKYQPEVFEEKWLDWWEKEEVYKTSPLASEPERKKQYVLSMFPYPSGAGLHVGHVRIYTGTDVLARFFRMSGNLVLHPMGWDAFGLPAENAAIKAKKNPLEMVPENIANFKRQMKRLGFSYDWDKEFTTTEPKYYRWTQWLFIQFFKMGLLYKNEVPVYYCPSCKTGLAEEEVLPDGTHERCQQPITRKTLPQWLFRITSYADRLLEDLKELDWPEGIIEMQKNWIGKSVGAEVNFPLKKIPGVRFSYKFVKVFTTRVDTLFGVTALVVAPEHWLIEDIEHQQVKLPKEKFAEIKDYVEKAKRKLDLTRTDLEKEKTGVDTTLKAIHPLTNEEIPIWVADYVIGWYGEGAVMVVPAHDERDFEFARKYRLPIRKVIANPEAKDGELSQALTKFGVLVNSGEFSGLTSKEAIEKITEKLQTLNLGRKKTTYKLRDWIFSRQRYWGEPIPMVFCQNCARKKITYWDIQREKKSFQFENEELSNLYGWFPVSESDLPLKLPYISSYEPAETGESPLSRIKEFLEASCPNCGKPAKRETDTMPNWAGSCWYFLAFPFWSKKDQSKSQEVTSKEAWKAMMNHYQSWLPVDWYLGGAEHAVLHLLYSRFWVKALSDLGLLTFREPFVRLRHVGMVLAEDHRKMSKSFGNVINPDDVIKEYGADALRLYEMFMAPFSSEIAWSTKALQGCYRFLKRVWELYNRVNWDQVAKNSKENLKLVAKLNRTLKKVTEDIPQIKFNTAVASMMEFLNEYEKNPQGLSKARAKKFLQILAPFAPFLTEEIWRGIFKEKKSIHLSQWPEFETVTEEEIEIPVQVNGKFRATIKIHLSKIKNLNEIKRESLKIEKIKRYLKGKEYEVIYIEGKVINFVHQ
ncbi:MAG: leucine--tRNA ligase [Patescibacteria group bacterium]|nr:leucine--tRNA ligase [Patescibacteria group bacterium]